MRTVTVTGRGQARVARDTAEVRVAAVHRATTLTDALVGVESARAAIVTVAGEHVEAAAVRTEGLLVWPNQGPDGETTAFEARHSLGIRCPDLATAGVLLGALAAAVGDRLRIDHVSLGVRDPAEAVGRARDEAFADARSRAERLAGLAVAGLGEVPDMTERDGGHEGFMEAALVDGPSVSLEPGETTIGQALTVTWELL